MKGPVQLPDGRFAKILWWDGNAQGWQIEVTSKQGRGERDIYPTRMLKKVDPAKWKEISGKRTSKKECQWCKQERPDTMGICPHCHRFPSQAQTSGACPNCQTPPPSYQSGVSCPNCEYQEHSFKQWLEDTMVGAASFGNEEDPDERGLKRISRLSRPVPDSQMADDLFGVKFFRKGSKKTGKRSKSSRPAPSTLRFPMGFRT